MGNWAYKRGRFIQVGDIVQVWWKPHRDVVQKITPFKGCFHKVLGEGTCIAQFVNSKMAVTIQGDEYYRVFIGTRWTIRKKLSNGQKSGA